MSASAPAIVSSLETTPRPGGNWSVQLHDVGKRYILGNTVKPEENFRAVLLEKLAGLVRPRPAGENREFWALRGVSFEIERGGTVGIIGRNGAGKSTMLKLLSRITAPTTGELRYRGRLASLLEVGTGFHRELTGRENIYLNGSILGMPRAEIRRHFDAIVDFAGVEQFLDTPVKHYSSGMYIRLAFAVAAHLRTDILVVDEVLAVGDAKFQKKCLGKMQDVASDGRTVFFVSHNMDSVRRLCRQAVVLRAGQLDFIGGIDEGIARYTEDGATQAEMTDRGPDPEKPIRLRWARLLSPSGDHAPEVAVGDPTVLEVAYDVNSAVEFAHLYLRLHDEQDRVVLLSGDRDSCGGSSARAVGRFVARVPLPTEWLNEGRYTVGIGAGIPFGEVFEMINAAIAFQVVDTQATDDRLYLQRRPGIIRRDIPWETKLVDAGSDEKDQLTGEHISHGN